MEKQVLIGVTESPYSRKALEYAAGMGSIIKQLHYTLLNVQPQISDFLLEDAITSVKAGEALKDLKSINSDHSNSILNESRKGMIRLGIDENRIHTVSLEQTMGTAKQILDYGKQTRSDAIVMGKRGVSHLLESFIGSVTNTVLEHTSVTPVWAIGGNAKPSRILLAIDGSESALRAVDHVSFMVGDNTESTISLLHVTPRLRDYCAIEFDEENNIMEDYLVKGNKQCVDSFYIHAKKIFKDAGLSESQISINEIKSTLNIGKTIVEEAAKDNFSTIVVGTRGLNKSFFMGSVASYILANAQDSAVWLVP
ncbi:MAG: universal stress protein [Deltaproteobacteria bacterium]|nr:universal stress protein [Deltaproteobacteria bacterium]